MLRSPMSVGAVLVAGLVWASAPSVPASLNIESSPPTITTCLGPRLTLNAGSVISAQTLSQYVAKKPPLGEKPSTARLPEAPLIAPLFPYYKRILMDMIDYSLRVPYKISVDLASDLIDVFKEFADRLPAKRILQIVEEFDRRVPALSREHLAELRERYLAEMNERRNTYLAESNRRAQQHVPPSPAAPQATPPVAIDHPDSKNPHSDSPVLFSI